MDRMNYVLAFLATVLIFIAVGMPLPPHLIGWLNP